MTSDAGPLEELIGLVDESELETVRTRSATFRANVNDRFGVFEGESVADGPSRSDE